MDYKNYQLLRKIITDYGYPDYKLVGQESSENFWLLVQHQDSHVSFQDSVLSLLKKAYEENRASGRNYAFLLDRVKCNRGELQIYGTQVDWFGNKCKPKPVAEPEKLDERRKAIGLGAEAEYLLFMEKRFTGGEKNK